jgi:hypothetical protein
MLSPAEGVWGSAPNRQIAEAPLSQKPQKANVPAIRYLKRELVQG